MCDHICREHLGGGWYRCMAPGCGKIFDKRFKDPSVVKITWGIEEDIDGRQIFSSFGKEIPED